MNNKSIEAIKSDLISLLDIVNNVVGCQKAMDAIAKLEGCAMTKDILEQTRIGKYVNELRKKTTDKNLSRRIKNLVRRWQDVVNNAGIDLNQPFKRTVGAVNGKHNSSIPSPSISTLNSQVNGKLKSTGETKLKEKNNQRKTTSPMVFSSSTSSPALSDLIRSQQSTPSIPFIGHLSKNVSPLVNNLPKSLPKPVPVSPFPKTKLSVINGHSNKIPNTPPITISTCDIIKATTQMAGKKRKLEDDSSDTKNANKKLKPTFPNNNVKNGNYPNNHVKNNLEKSHNESNSQPIMGCSNEDSNDSKLSLKLQGNTLVNGGSFDEKVFSCNSTGNLKCKISRYKPAHTPPLFPSSLKLTSTRTPPIISFNKFKSVITPPVPSSLIRSKTPTTSSIRSKTSNTPPIITSSSTKHANTPPIASTPSHKPLKKCLTASGGLHHKPLVKHSKVDTTAQILQKLHSNSNLPLSHTLEQIAKHRIKRELSEDEEVSVLSQRGTKPRGGKRRSKLVPPHSNAQEVARAKDERMQIFLHSTSSTIPKNHSASNLQSYCKEESKSRLSNGVKSEVKNHTIMKGKKISLGAVKSVPVKEVVETKEVVDVSKLDPQSAEYRAALLKNPWAFLPPLEDLKISCDGDEEEGNVKKGDGEVGNGEGREGGKEEKVRSEDGDIEERLKRLSVQRWVGVNGLEDPRGQWKDWSSSFSVKIHDDYCHILPYVCL